MHKHPGHQSVIAAICVLVAMSIGVASAESPRVIEITAEEFGFEPASIEVQRGETVEIRLVNEGALSHNLLLEGAEARTRTLQGGKTGSVTFTPEETGSVRFHCDVPGHEQAGMHGEMHVR